MAKSLFLDAVRAELRTRHYSLKTEKSYLYWIRQFIFFNDKRPGHVGIQKPWAILKLNAFLTTLQSIAA
jgi:hypothetical protein